MSISFNDLKLVNSKINMLPYCSEVEDDWKPITEAGDDCDSYATAKFERLTHMGWPNNFLRFATCYIEPFKLIDKITGQLRDAEMDERYHLVLLVDWDSQTYVLDNRHPLPMEYDLLPYRWHLLQVAGTQNWEHA
jgi:predicted transglutaminase-like cysteine proteinase